MTVVRWVRGFGLFWWDFIVGDSIVLAIGVLIAVGVTFALAKTGSTGVVEVVLPVVVCATLAASLLRWKR